MLVTTLQVQGELPLDLVNRWNATRRFGRLQLSPPFLAFCLDVSVAGGVAPNFVRAQIEIWDRLVQELIAYLREELPKVVAANAADRGRRATGARAYGRAGAGTTHPVVVPGSAIDQDRDDDGCLHDKRELFRQQRMLPGSVRRAGRLVVMAAGVVLLLFGLTQTGRCGGSCDVVVQHALCCRSRRRSPLLMRRRSRPAEPRRSRPMRQRAPARPDDAPPPKGPIRTQGNSQITGTDSRARYRARDRKGGGGNGTRA